jgi:hypothetical protein
MVHLVLSETAAHANAYPRNIRGLNRMKRRPLSILLFFVLAGVTAAPERNAQESPQVRAPKLNVMLSHAHRSSGLTSLKSPATHRHTPTKRATPTKQRCILGTASRALGVECVVGGVYGGGRGGGCSVLASVLSASRLSLRGAMGGRATAAHPHPHPHAPTPLQYVRAKECGDGRWGSLSLRGGAGGRAAPATPPLPTPPPATPPHAPLEYLRAKQCADAQEVRLRVYICIHTYKHTNIHTYIHTYVCMYVCCMYVCMYDVYICMYVCMLYVCMYV